jgi:hypothetical protein
LSYIIEFQLLKWKQLLQQEFCQKFRSTVDKYHQQQYEYDSNDGKYDMPFVKFPNDMLERFQR